MFVFFKSPFYNKKLSDYCNKSTMESIRKLKENYKKNNIVESFLYKNNNILIDSYTPIPPPNYNNIFLFFSLSSMLYFFFSCTKNNKLKNI
jgi:hypothetical protein